MYARGMTVREIQGHGLDSVLQPVVSRMPAVPSGCRLTRLRPHLSRARTDKGCRIPTDPSSTVPFPNHRTQRMTSTWPLVGDRRTSFAPIGEQRIEYASSRVREIASPLLKATVHQRGKPRSLTYGKIVKLC
jgi:hypothetical protein